MALALLTAGCGFKAPDRTTLGVQRVGLDLTYSDDALKVVVPPRVIVKFVPAAPQDIAAAVPAAQEFLPDVVGPPVPPSGAPPEAAPPEAAAAECPKAPKGATPEEPAPVAITTPPVAGTYLQRNVGTIKVSGATPLTFDYPSFSQIVVRDVKSVEVVDPSFGRERRTSFVVEDQILPTFKIVSSYEYNPRQLNLLRRDTVSGTTTTTFTPTPVVPVFVFGGQGASFTGTGLDTGTLNSLTVRGSIAAPEPIDVCGVLIDAQRVSTDEQQVDLMNGSRGGTRSGMPNITHYSTQLGGLTVRREQHTTQVVRTQAGPVTFDTDVVSTLMSVDPRNALP